MTEQNIPQNLEIEETVIGTIFRGGRETYELVSDFVSVSDFYSHSLQTVWNAIENVYQDGLQIDSITVGDFLERNRRLQDVSHGQKVGLVYLSYIHEAAGLPGNIESYADQLKEYSVKRELLNQANQIAAWSFNGRRAKDIVSDVVHKFGEIQVTNGQADKHTQSIGDAVSDAYTHTSKAANGEIHCVQTGLIDLDTLLTGVYGSDLLLIAGRPGQGKSALLTTIGKNVAETGKRVAIFGLEMSNKQTAQRLVAQVSGVPTDRQRSGKLLEDEWVKYTNGVEEISQLPIILNDMPAISPNGIRKVLRKIGDVDLVIVDYIQLQKSDEKSDVRYQEVDAISRGLKGVAKEFDIPVLAAAQLSRAVEQRSNKRPVLSDLRESGGLEQDSDVVMFIYRADLYEKNATQNIVEVIVAKHRNGSVGSVELVFRPTLTKFENAVTKQVEFA